MFLNYVEISTVVRRYFTERLLLSVLKLSTTERVDIYTPKVVVTLPQYQLTYSKKLNLHFD